MGLLEFPPTVLKLKWLPIPFSGGFYLRSIPYMFTRIALKHVEKDRHGMIYMHPWEADDNIPRVKCSPLVWLVQYYKTGSVMNKLEKLTEDFEFMPIGEIIKNGDYPVFELMDYIR